MTFSNVLYPSYSNEKERKTMLTKKKEVLGEESCSHGYFSACGMCNSTSYVQVAVEEEVSGNY
jgi:hypothetical protein